ncbi:hypothetical protein TPHA_0N00430 [Tetrapisispora phaffii CBS 4417]|uniref:SWIRM domain-containing protein n=1 Tax=Tetrapisispora phaffii (strain ATCC 24235 / CBS 4417 / NBRC 1672 / NRRL Y-8282 / UCD 70-5) TaxID=1071381 RepID=G8C0Z5_TETPH|nr:hypothetical protein TPHA_0N00430 [Tetrapisispora phaffii CBS 4417]CCE65823.1 hypothetical protein TPHA_0N00430 [Tetrapisispora phaffii CBS 4417]
MVYQSPRAETSQLSSILSEDNDQGLKLLQQLHHKCQNATSSVIGPNLMQDNSNTQEFEEKLIPSPPMSPVSLPLVVSKTQLKAAIQPGKKNFGIVVGPVWKEFQSHRTYNKISMLFLRQYKSFSQKKTNTSSYNSYSYSYKRQQTIRRQTSILGSAPDSDSNGYRTRGNSRKTYSRSGSDDIESSTLSVRKEFTEAKIRKSSPSRSGRKLTGKVSASSMHSPLSSLKALKNNTQYIPNVTWKKLEDYSPPLSSLPDNDYCLRIEWKGSSMNLDSDPLRDYLHPAEIVLAQILRLPCDLYLDSKRRLFLEKVYRAKEGLSFRRTDAQKACKIDVNKASRLYAAFEKIGWLDDSYFEEYI